MTRTEVALAGMRFHVRVGILPHERALPQPLEVDLRVGRRDGHAAVLDYRSLYALVHDIVAADPHDYLETVGERIMKRVLAIDGVAWARIAVRKPHVALAGPLAYAEVTLEGAND